MARSEKTSTTMPKRCKEQGNDFPKAAPVYKIERDPLAEIGPDGVPLWRPNESARWTKQTDGEFIWLEEEHPELASWIPWAHRWCSIVYAEALEAAIKKNRARPLTSAGTAMAVAAKSLRLFFLEYLCQADNTGQIKPEWRLDPAELLTPTGSEDAEIELRDSFWKSYTNPHPTARKRTKSSGEEARSSDCLNVAKYLNWLADRLNSEAFTLSGPTNEKVIYRNPFWVRNMTGAYILDGQLRPIKKIARKADKDFSWITREFPHLRAWQPLAKEYISQRLTGVHTSMAAISIFICQHLANSGVPLTPGALLPDDVVRDPLQYFSRSRRTPDTYSQDKTRIIANATADFLDWVLINRLSEPDGQGGYVTPADYVNPIKRLQSVGNNNRHQTSRSAMPYAWVQQLRRILAEGEHFQHWKWAQQAQRSSRGFSHDWFEVPENLIDRNDPDCVWRTRTTGTAYNNDIRTFYEIWSPVRWVALLIKLNLPVRNIQVRMLDSGESDHWRFDISQWCASGDFWIPNDIENRNPALARSIGMKSLTVRTSSRSAWSNGTLRRVNVISEGFEKQAELVLYINTNKTADSKLEGAAKGYEIPMPVEPCPLFLDHLGEMVKPTFSGLPEEFSWLDSLSRNVYYWLAKLRDWQSKYNPISRRTPWRELEKTGLATTKSEEQYQMFHDVCFLFREPALRSGKEYQPHLPMPDSVLRVAWWTLCSELQSRFLSAGKVNLDGAHIELVADQSGYHNYACTFDLHAIRVSLISALVNEGKLPLELVQKIVGHSRIVMTAYYTVITNEQKRQYIREAQENMERRQFESEASYLRNASIEQLRERAAFNDEDSVMRALGLQEDATSGLLRTASGWLETPFGICPVGGNVMPMVDARTVAGCFNGGPATQKGGHLPVEGGARSCPNCRWFLTSPAYLFGLVAKFNNTAYYLDEAKKKALADAGEVSRLSGLVYEGEKTGVCETELKQLRQALFDFENQAESSASRLTDHALILGNTHRLIQRCLVILQQRPSNSPTALVLAGGEAEWKVVINDTESELLQASIVARDAEVYPELDAGKAILRRSQIIDRKLMQEGHAPLFMTLSEEEQKRAGNAFMRRIGDLLSPDRPGEGFAKAVRLIDSKEPIAHHLGLNKAAMKSELDRCLDPRESVVSPLVFESGRSVTLSIS